MEVSIAVMLPREMTVDLAGKAKRVRIYVNEDDKVGRKPVPLALLEFLRRENAQGATVFRAMEGFGATGQIHTSGPVTVEARTPLPRIAEIMTRRRLKRLPVVDEHGAMVGIVSRVDLLRTAAGAYELKEPVPQELGLAGDVPLSRVVRRDAPVVHPETPLPEVFQAIVSTRLNHALVLDSEGRVVGLVTDAELLDRLTPSLRPGALRSLMHRLPFAHPKEKERVAEQHARARRAADLMTTRFATATEETLLSSAIARMLGGSHKVLAVTDASGRLTGIVDRADLLHGLLPHSSS